MGQGQGQVCVVPYRLHPSKHNLLDVAGVGRRPSMSARLVGVRSDRTDCGRWLAGRLTCIPHAQIRQARAMDLPHVSILVVCTV